MIACSMEYTVPVCKKGVFLPEFSTFIAMSSSVAMQEEADTRAYKGKGTIEGKEKPRENNEAADEAAEKTQ